MKTVEPPSSKQSSSFRSWQGFERCAFNSGTEGFAVVPEVFGDAKAHTLFMTFAAGDDNIANLCPLNPSFEARLNSTR